MENYIEPVNETHNGMLHAAAMGGCDIKPMVGMTQYIGWGETKYGFGPACLIDMAGTDYVAEPHVTWFPWTSASNRMKNFKWAMRHFSKDKEVMLVIEEKEKTFFEHFVKKGLLRKIGYIDNLPEVVKVHMYQYKKEISNE